MKTKDEKKDLVLLGVSIDKSTKELLNKEAEKEKRSLSSHVVWILEKHLSQ